MPFVRIYDEVISCLALPANMFTMVSLGVYRGVRTCLLGVIHVYLCDVDMFTFN